MVTGGKGEEDLIWEGSVELHYTNGTSLCTLPDLIRPRYEHTQNGPIVCGGSRGSTTHSCQKFCGGFWNETHRGGFREDRMGHGSWASPGGLMLIGGHSGRSTSEIVSEDGSKSTWRWYSESDETLV